jgi:hypothetical protein
VDRLLDDLQIPEAGSTIEHEQVELFFGLIEWDLNDLGMLT